MKKVAILTEGQTESILASALIEFFASGAPYHAISKRLYGGRRFDTIEIEVSENGQAGADYFFLILDCGSDGRVISEINDRYDGFVNADYTHILGIRDLFPDFSRSELKVAQDGFAKSLRMQPIEPKIFIAVVEVEGWFFAENIHFSRLDASLTPDKILADTDIDIIINSESRDQPAEDLNVIYNTVGLQYKKARLESQRTVSALEIREYLAGAGARAPSIGPLLATLIDIFAS